MPHPTESRFLPGTVPPRTDDLLSDLIGEHGSLLFRVAVSITHNRALAEEVVQDSFFQAWLAMPSWEDDVPVRWLRRVTRNRAISVMRKESRSTPVGEWQEQRSPHRDVESVVEGREVLGAVEDALMQLDDASRTMLVLRETEELSYDEIGELLGLSPSAVKSKLYRARHALKQQLGHWDL